MSFKKIVAGIVLGLMLTAAGQCWAPPAEASWYVQRLLELRQQQQSQDTRPAQPKVPAPQPAPKPPTPEPVPAKPPASEPAAPVQLNSQEQALLELLNQERQKQGLKPLSLHPKLVELAQRKSADIVENNYFAHTSPTLGSFAQMVRSAGISYRSVGENLAMARNAQYAFYLLLGSAPHKANMLNPHFTHIGIGVVPNKYGVVVTQLFIQQ
ncbi:MAG: hypothetical protein GX039_00940 [Clostridia bacterium]|nr:hypothetical protein [Clostridia bacterium]